MADNFDEFAQELEEEAKEEATDDGDAQVANQAEEEHPEKEEESAEVSDKKAKKAKKSKKEADSQKDEKAKPFVPVTATDSETVGESGRLFIRNLSFAVTEDELLKLFKRYGPVAEIHIPLHPETKQPRGIAFVTYMMSSHAVKAFNDLDGKIFQGRLLHVLPAKEKPEAKPKEVEVEAASTNTRGGNPKATEFQKKRDEKKKKHFSEEAVWNSLFLRTDTVVEAMAEKYGISKSEILDRDAGNMAVRVALGETAIIAETKQMLEKEGVVLDVLAQHRDGAVKRSRTVMLVKNLPHNTTEQELRDTFGKFGALGRVILTPSRALALIEFVHGNEAKIAFSSLNYARFKFVPLKLEWAPMQVLAGEAAGAAAARAVAAEAATTPSSSSARTAATNGAVDTETAKAPEAEKETVGGKRKANPKQEDTEDVGEGDGKTLLITNINWITTEEALRIHFEAQKITPRSIVLAKKRDPKSGDVMSMGYGFVEFASKEDATKALRNMQGSKLDDYALKLQYSNSKGQKKTATADSKRKTTTDVGKPTNKLLIRNVPFEATVKELKELFGAYGQVQKVRLPKKNTPEGGSGHRGFAFVEFLTKQEAKNAMQALAATHLYGRHLVIEFAKLDKNEEAALENQKQLATFTGNSDFIPL